jgi:hypothetical protein
VIKHVLELFFCKTEIKICFERWLFLSTTGNGVLTIFHTKQLLREIGTFVLFYKAWHSSPLFLSQTMCNTSLFVDQIKTLVKCFILGKLKTFAKLCA